MRLTGFFAVTIPAVAQRVGPGAKMEHVTRSPQPRPHHLLGTWRQTPGQNGMTITGVEHISADAFTSIAAAVGRYRDLSERINSTSWRQASRA